MVLYQLIISEGDNVGLPKLHHITLHHVTLCSIMLHYILLCSVKMLSCHIHVNVTTHLARIYMFFFFLYNDFVFGGMD